MVRTKPATATVSKHLGDVFGALRGVLEPLAGSMIVQTDTPSEYQLCSSEHKDRIGRPLMFAAVQIRKNYVTFHLMPMSGSAALNAALSPGLRKRMQGKACFNFKTAADAAAHKSELAELTRRGARGFRDLKLPW
jgi:hypothetical protein